MPTSMASPRSLSYRRDMRGFSQKECTVRTVENTSSAISPAREYMGSNFASFFVSIPMQTLVTISIVGTIAIVIKVSFHEMTKATMKAVTKVDAACIVSVSFSEMPLLTLFPLVVACTVTDAAASESKYAIFCRRICLMKSIRKALVVRIADMDIST